MWKLALVFICFTAVHINATVPVVFPGMREGIAESPKRSSEFRSSETSYRLPANVIPRQYTITIVLTESETKFDGSVFIDLRILEPTNSIVLHAHKIRIMHNNVSIIRHRTIVSLTELEHDEAKQMYTFHLSHTLRPRDPVRLGIGTFYGQINRDNTGFYLGQYFMYERFFATNLYPIYARALFPCFDQPDMKAKFTLSIASRAGYYHVTNMPEVKKRQQYGSGLLSDHYQKTPTMAPYVLVFFISEINIKRQSAYKTIYAPARWMESGRTEFGYKTATKVMKILDQYTGIQYSKHMPKLDQVTIDDQYLKADSIPGWGLILYRDTNFLLSNELSTTAEMLKIYSTIAHSFAHQWFGSLVSPEWWDIMWMTEGITTYFQHYVANELDPSTQMMDLFLIWGQHKALDTDSTHHNRPMTASVETPAAIIGGFDEITYLKGASMFRMMETFLGPEVFQAGIRNYVKEDELGIVDPDDLWKAMQRAANATKRDNMGGQTVKLIMDTWTTSAGYPVVTVSRNNLGAITLHQDRFIVEKQRTDPKVPVWPIPINWATEDDLKFNDVSPRLWLKVRRQKLDVTVAPEKWLIVNVQERGFYRVNYDEKNWRLLINYLRSDNFYKIHYLNRAQLIDDAFFLARSRRISYATFLELGMYIFKEKNYFPMAAFFNAILWLDSRLANSLTYNHFKLFVNSNIQTAFEELTILDQGSTTDKLNRERIIYWLCRLEHEDCMNQMHKHLMALESSTIPPNLEAPVFCGGMRLKNESESKFLILHKHYNSLSTLNYLKKKRVLNGIACSLDEKVLKIFLRNATDQWTGYVGVAPGDVWRAVYESSAIGTNVALDFIMEKYPYVKATFSDMKDVKQLVMATAKRCYSKRLLDKVAKFLNRKETRDEDEKIFAEAKSVIHYNIGWAEGHFKELETWLSENFVAPENKPDATNQLMASIWLIASINFVVIIDNTQLW